MAGFFTSRLWRGRPYLISPFADFVCAGGLAPLLLLGLMIGLPASHPHFSEQQANIAALMGWLAYVLNNPHFMTSYQLLYDRFPEKLQRFRDKPAIYGRYILAGIIVPAGMAGYFLYALTMQKPALILYAAEAMLVLAGWHYVK